jgi:3-hydroxyacyl-[acyl-carrier-protein] dehydratase
MTLAAIEAAIPHREPFLLLDEIVEQQENRITCRKTFRGDEFWFAGHYPEFPLVPGVLLCEAAMQAGAVLLARHVQGLEGVPVATRMGDVRFKQMVQPGDTVTLDVTLDEQVSHAFYLTARVTVRGRMAARLTFACTMATAGQTS